MILQRTDDYIRACMKTWMLCESCIHAENDSKSPSQSLIDKCRGCANSCFSVVCRIITPADNMQEALIQESALNCLLYCRDCYEECKNHRNNDDIWLCGEVCWLCAQTLGELIISFHLN